MYSNPLSASNTKLAAPKLASPGIICSQSSWHLEEGNIAGSSGILAKGLLASWMREQFLAQGYGGRWRGGPHGGQRLSWDLVPLGDAMIHSVGGFGEPGASLLEDRVRNVQREKPPHEPRDAGL